MDIFILNVVGAIAIAVIVLIVSNKLILRRALKKIIIPDLKAGGYKLDVVKSVGFLQEHEFPEEKIHLRPFTLGYPVYSNYVNLEYSSLEKEYVKFKVTAKISVLLFFVRKVEYSHPL